MHQQEKATINLVFRIFFLALPFVYFPFLVDPVLVPRQIFLNIFLLALLVLIYRSKDMAVDRRFFRQRLFAVCVGWVGINIISGIFCINTAEWISGVSKYFLYILFFFIVSVFILSGMLDGKELIKSVILFSAVVIAIAIFQIVKIIFSSPESLWKNLDLISSSLSNRNLLSSCLFLTFPFLLSSDTLDKSWKQLSSALFVAALLVIIVLQAKAVWIACIVFLGVLYYYRKKIYPDIRKNSGKKVSIPLIIVLVFVFTVLGIYTMNYFDNQFGRKFFIYANTFPSTNRRALLWQNSIDMIKEHFIFGVGTNNWQIWFPHEKLSKLNESVAGGIATFHHPHNDFLWVFSETGVFGFIFFLLIFFTAVRYCFRLMRNSTDDASIKKSVLFAAAVIGYAIISFVDFPLERVEHNILFFSIIAIITTDYLNRFNYYGRKRNIKRNLVIALGALSVFTLVVAACRFTGEYHSRILRSEHEAGNWNNVISEKNKAKNIFYNLDFFSAPLAWHSGVAYSNMGNIPGAMREYEEAYHVHPYNINVLKGLASCYEKSNRHEDALSFHKKVLEISPDSRESLLDLSGESLKTGDFEEAFRLIDRCAVDTNDVKYMTYLSAILEKKKIPVADFISSKRELLNKIQ